MDRALGSVSASGFSHSTARPRSSAAVLTSAWASGIVTLTTASASTRSSSFSSVVATATAAKPASAAECRAVSRSRSATPTSRTSVDWPITRSQARPTMPAPTWTSRTGSAGEGIGLLLLVGLDRSGVAVAGEEVIGVVAQQGRQRSRPLAFHPGDAVRDYSANVGVVVHGVILVTRREEEDLAVAPPERAAAAEHLATGEGGDEDQLVRGRDVEGLAVHLLGVDDDRVRNALGDRVR